MRIAFVSDIHSNIEAFSVALDLIKKRKVQKIMSCGDIVGYGPDPEEAISIFIENGIVSVRGNHDSGVVGDSILYEFNEYARLALIYTKRNISKASENYLKGLPTMIENDDFTIFHGFPNPKNPFRYILSEFDVMEAFSYIRTKIAFYGHTHVPCICRNSPENIIEVLPLLRQTKFKLDKDYRYLINVGSVGQPRDGNPKGAFVIYDSEEYSIEFIRFSYNIEKVYQKIIERNLPSYLGERLFTGF
ncbi:MAG: metallophosphoesterase family protein [Caldisericum sp.]|jgi:predicted phosphodiesterase|uniref:metallophosphoesterase family protein n=1 Tax=Caldisericum TaxID=693074 RepID=UPI003C74737F